MTPDYYASGKFSESERILKIGPRKEVPASLATRMKQTRSGGVMWIGRLEEVSGEKTKEEIVFERNAEGKRFKSEEELLDYLTESFSITHLRDKLKPAVSTSG